MSSNTTRNKTIDIVKGILIIIVIISHIIPGEVRDSFGRYILMSFEMPLFFAVSGYLLNISKLAKFSFRELTSSYIKCIVIPWVIAMNIYFLIINYYFIINLDFNELLFKYLKFMVRPWYHLWFVEGFLFCVFTTWSILKINKHKKDNAAFRVMVVLSIIFVSIFGFNISINNKYMDIVYFLIKYNLQPYHFIFFVLGIVLRNINNKIVKKVDIKLLLISFFFLFIIRIKLFDYNYYFLENVIFYILNTFGIILIIHIIELDNSPKYKFLSFVGINSFAFYLWHVIPIIFLKKIFIKYSYLYYIISALTIMLDYIIIKLGLKNKIISKYFFGIDRSDIDD